MPVTHEGSAGIATGHAAYLHDAHKCRVNASAHDLCDLEGNREHIAVLVQRHHLQADGHRIQCSMDVWQSAPTDSIDWHWAAWHSQAQQG